jgi:hypothetical protein
VLPIENSPPEIQTVPAGAGPGAVEEFGTVPENAIEPADGHDSHSALIVNGVVTAERDLDARSVTPTTAPTAMRLVAISQSFFELSALDSLGSHDSLSVLFLHRTLPLIRSRLEISNLSRQSRGLQFCDSGFSLITAEHAVTASLNQDRRIAFGAK